MRKYIDNTRGAAGVLLCLLLASLVLVVSLLCGALCLSGGKATLNRALSLSAKSLMSEYDRNLYADYGIFALQTDEERAAKTILQYTDKMVRMKGEGDKLDMFGLGSINVKVDLKACSLMDLTNFEEQICRDMKYKMILDALGLPTQSANAAGQLAQSGQERAGGKQQLKEAENAAAEAERAQADTAQNSEQDGEAGQTETQQKSKEARKTIDSLKTMAESGVKKTGLTDTQQTRVLRNKSVIGALPSEQAGLHDTWTSSLLKGADIFKNVFSGENAEFYQFENLPGDLIKGAELNEYILKYCQNRHKEAGEKETFFQNEAEYVLYGNRKDSENYSAFKEKFLTLRTALNLLHIYSDAEKKEEVRALASAAFPGPGAVAAQLVIATAWAAAESVEDLKILENQGKVPLIKSKTSWRLSWQNLLAGESLSPPEKETTTGLDYEDYLRIFLACLPRDTKLLRMMDIIQLNMKGRYYRDFTLKSCYTGFSVEAEGKTRAIGPVLRKGGETWVSVTSVHAY